MLLVQVATLALPLVARAAAPVARDDVYEAKSGSLLAVAVPGVLANDTDADGNAIQAILVFDGADHGSLALFGDGHFTYTSEAGFSGVDSFGYRISDGSTTADARVYILVPDGSPVAVDDLYLTPKDETLAIAAPGVLENDFDLDGDSVQAVLVTSSVTHGSLSLFPDGHFNYTPDTGFVGVDGFGYRISDGASTAEARVSIGVPEPRGGAAAMALLALAGLGWIRHSGRRKTKTKPKSSA